METMHRETITCTQLCYLYSTLPPLGLRDEHLKRGMMLKTLRLRRIKVTLPLDSDSGVEGWLIGPDGKSARKIELEGKKEKMTGLWGAKSNKLRARA